MEIRKKMLKPNLILDRLNENCWPMEAVGSITEYRTICVYNISLVIFCKCLRFLKKKKKLGTPFQRECKKNSKQFHFRQA